MQDFQFTLWDVGHGLCIWIQTPNGQNQWFDCGNTEDFSPSKHVKEKHGVAEIQYLIISYPDEDHLRDLPNLIQNMGIPRALCRNRSLPSEEKYGTEDFDYQETFKWLDLKLTRDAPEITAPWNALTNGGVEMATGYNTYTEGITSNDSSVVVLYHYAGWLLVCPGDIEDIGWRKLWSAKRNEFQRLISKSKWRVLVAPHHGRPSGYSQAMMDNIKPHFAIISDVAGQSETDPRFRENPVGLTLRVRPETEERLVKYLSTKLGGRVQFSISSDGLYTLHQYEYW